MKFEFNTEVDGATEAAALVTALTVLHGDAVAVALDKADRALTPLAADGHPFNAADHATHAATAPTPPSTAATDSAGIPWDARIHASTKTTNKDGTWSRRRNTPDATYDAVMAELTAKEASAEEAFADPTHSAAPAAQGTDGSGTEADTAGQTATTAASPSNPPPPPPPTTASLVTFPSLLVKITKAQGAQKIDKATVDGFFAQFGLASAKDLNGQGPDVLEAINAMVDAHLNG